MFVPLTVWPHLWWDETVLMSPRSQEGYKSRLTGPAPSLYPTDTHTVTQYTVRSFPPEHLLVPAAFYMFGTGLLLRSTLDGFPSRQNSRKFLKITGRLLLLLPVLQKNEKH